MCEDDRPLYDIENCWELQRGMCTMTRLIFKHKEKPSLYRLVDSKEKKVVYSDTKRVTTSSIIDINRKLSDMTKEKLINISIGLSNLIIPIKMPYKPEVLKVFISFIDNYVGFLYFKDSDSNLVQIKRYFGINYLPDGSFGFYEVSFEEFKKAEQLYFEKENNNVDTDTEQTANN